MTINSLHAIDLVGRRIYTLEVKNLITGEVLSDKIKNTTGNSTWAGDKTIFYTTQDANTLRSDTVLKHKLGTDTAEDEVVYFEKDDTFDGSW
jgi:oligopeptidase B